MCPGDDGDVGGDGDGARSSIYSILTHDEVLRGQTKLYQRQKAEKSAAAGSRHVNQVSSVWHCLMHSLLGYLPLR